jgi:hypothetical protein
MVLNRSVELTVDQQVESQAVMKSLDVLAPVVTRAPIVLRYAEGRLKKQVAELARVSRPMVDLWWSRYQAEGLAGLVDRSHTAPRKQTRRVCMSHRYVGEGVAQERLEAAPNRRSKVGAKIRRPRRTPICLGTTSTHLVGVVVLSI